MGKATRERRVAVDRVEPTPEQLRRNRFALVQVKDPDQAAPIIVRRNLTTRNLERWFNRELIDSAQLAAGDRYRSDYERAGFEQRVTSRYDIVTAGAQGAVFQPAMPGTLRQMDAWDRYRDARAQIDPALVWGFDSMILHDASFGDVPAGHDRLKAFTRDRWGLVVTLCLARLVTHYRL
jgi:hypothetical protein